MNTQHDNANTFQSEPEGPHRGARPENADRRAARAIGDATRDAEQLLADLPTMHLSDAEAVAHLTNALRRLTDAIEAISGHRQPKPQLSEAEVASVIAAGVPASAFTPAARRRGEDWLVWSALSDEAERQKLDELARIDAFDIVPGLRELVDDLSPRLIDLDLRAVLLSPHEELDGLSPIRWLLTGGDPSTVRSALDGVGEPL